MPNVVYDNFFLANEVEDQYNSHLDLTPFVTVNNDLTDQDGMKYIVHRYSATDSTEKLAMGEGNTETSEVSYTEEEYDIGVAQNRFSYYDEEVKKDSKAIDVGIANAGVTMFNTTQGDIYSEYQKATLIVPTDAFDFDAFVDGEGMLNRETGDDVAVFAFVSIKDRAEIKKKLKDDLKYVEAFSRRGYIGSVNNIAIYAKKDAIPGKIVIATKRAVTLFNKSGTEIETERDANIRKNTVYSRKYYVVALTDARDAVLVVKGSAALSEDTSVQSGKTYFAAKDTGYVVVTPAAGDNPVTKGWYEITLS